MKVSETTGLNNDRIVELFKQEYAQYGNFSTPVIETLKDFGVFRLGYYLGGTDTLKAVSMKMKSLYREIKE